MTTGLGSQASLSSDIVEIINLGSSTFICSPLPPLPAPFAMFFALGGLGYSNEPFICAGSDYSGLYESLVECYSYFNNAWQVSSYHRNFKNFASGSFAFSPSQTGPGKAIAVAKNNIDVLSYNNWILSSAVLPAVTRFGCTVAINSTTYMIFQGYNGTSAISSDTYYFDVETDILTAGPPVLVPRAHFQCSMIRSADPNHPPYVMIAGGIGDFGMLTSSEFLNLNTGEWLMGPNLPIHIRDGVMLEHPYEGW